ncbi:hypothetical protein QM999_09570 [Pectobacterium cacticida]|uniref:hypothetical protein n=1 Tax=Pectobacterium cacticida TaxID=69221 RepID=UPI002FEEAB19
MKRSKGTLAMYTGRPPAGAARGGDGEHGNERGAGDCEPGAASAAGLGRGRGEALQRRDAGTASSVGLTSMLAED